jgi:hypothetical protein
MNCIYLWGLRLSRISSGQLLTEQEHAIYDRITRHLQTQLGDAGEDLDKALQMVQAEVLLSTYLFARGRALEANYHVSAAVSMATMYGMHTIIPQTPALAGPPGVAAVDPVVEGERIRVFWRVFVLDKCFAVANNSAALIRDDDRVRVNTPWPLDAEYYGSVSTFISTLYCLF